MTKEPMYRWEQVNETAAFAPRDGAGLLSYQGRMWLLGGWNPRDKVHFPRICNNEVWSSTDGADWQLEVRQAPWEGRHAAGSSGRPIRMTSACVAGAVTYVTTQ